jgi:hypothetical protein
VDSFRLLDEMALLYIKVGVWCPVNTKGIIGCIEGADKSLARTTSRCILCDGENISFDVTLVIYIYSTNISPIMII